MIIDLADRAISGTLDRVRARGGELMRTAIIGNEGLRPDELASPDDPGLFGPHSAAWRVHGNSSMLIGGLRALLLQTLHPATMAGVADHSNYKNDPWGRLHRTGRFVGATTFGRTAVAEGAIAQVRTIHNYVSGTLPNGESYFANDPHLLNWVHITEVDSFYQAYARHGARPMSEADADRYVAEMAVVATGLGVIDPPANQAELAAAIDSYRPECEVSPQTQEAVGFLLIPPVPLVLRGGYGTIAAGAVALLPRWAQAKLGLLLPPAADPVVIKPAATAITRSIGWLMSHDPAVQERQRWTTQ